MVCSYRRGEPLGYVHMVTNFSKASNIMGPSVLPETYIKCADELDDFHLLCLRTLPLCLVTLLRETLLARSDNHLCLVL